MNGIVRKSVVLVGLVVAAGVCEIPIGGLLIAPSEARIGRPLTPVSVAGVARRTTRRTIRRTAVYVAALPVGCTIVVIEGMSLHQCGTVYYQAHGTQYVVIEVQ